MDTVMVVGAVWFTLGLGLALLLASAVRVADGHRPADPTEPAFTADGHPFAVPLRAAPDFGISGGPPVLVAPPGARSVGLG